jgi:CheY-specific phosphatase CheX
MGVLTVTFDAGTLHAYKLTPLDELPKIVVIEGDEQGNIRVDTEPPTAGADMSLIMLRMLERFQNLPMTPETVSEIEHFVAAELNKYLMAGLLYAVGAPDGG